MNIINVLTRLETAFKDFQTSADQILTVIGWLKHYGYLATDGELTPEDVVNAIKLVQKVIGFLKVDGVLGPKTFHALINTPRCARSDESITQKAAIESLWAQKHLTYVITQRDNDLTAQRWDAIIEDAFRAWSDVCGLTFERVTNQNSAKLVLSVGAGPQYGFDGPGRTLAWAQLPPRANFNGQLLCRFDTDETWTEYGSGKGIYLRNVATHEIGHLIGLGHSSISSSLMAPFYSPPVKDPQENDDISRIQKLYGKNTGTPVPPTPPTPPTPPPTPPSPPAPPTNIPAPTNLKAALNANLKVVLSWEDNSTGEDAFEFERNGVNIGSVGRGRTTATDNGVELNQTYTYRTRARVEQRYSAWSNAATIVVAEPRPEPPTPEPEPKPLEEITIKIKGRDLEIVDISDHRTRKI